jgi:hypothetical protein
LQYATFAFEHQVRFLFEKRSKLYMKYSARVSQKKIADDAKSRQSNPSLAWVIRRGAKVVV